MYIERHEVAVTTNGSGAFTGYTAKVTGIVHQIRYVPDGSAPLDTGADVDITGEVTGTVLLDKDNIGTAAFNVAPRQPTHDTGLAASLYASGGEPVEAPIAMADERIKVVIASGGSAKAGTFHIWVG